jgi:hypothetical protein
MACVLTRHEWIENLLLYWRKTFMDMGFRLYQGRMRILTIKLFSCKIWLNYVVI